MTSAATTRTSRPRPPPRLQCRFRSCAHSLSLWTVRVARRCGCRPRGRPRSARPRSMNSPSETTSTRSPSNVGDAAGRSGDDVRARACRASGGRSRARRRSLRRRASSVSSTSRRAEGQARQEAQQQRGSPRSRPAARARPAPDGRDDHGRTSRPRRPGSAPGRRASATMPSTPATPKPGNDEDLERQQDRARPPTSSSSSQPASCTSQWPQKKSARLPMPTSPGTPKPGVRSSTMMPEHADRHEQRAHHRMGQEAHDAARPSSATAAGPRPRPAPAARARPRSCRRGSRRPCA